jgi:hypothetical protein
MASFPKRGDESGSGLIWFITLLALVALFIGTLVSASSEYLMSRQVTDFTEQFALGVKTKLLASSTEKVDVIGKSFFEQVAANYHFRNLVLKTISLGAGNTVHAVVCVTWDSPFSGLTAGREICEEAFAR